MALIISLNIPFENACVYFNIFYNYRSQCVCVHLLVFTEDTDLRKNVQIMCSGTMACFDGHALEPFYSREGEGERKGEHYNGRTDK
jgi:hypothetical protein